MSKMPELPPCPCGLATCQESWEPGCGLGNSEEHAVVVVTEWQNKEFVATADMLEAAERDVAAFKNSDSSLPFDNVYEVMFAAMTSHPDFQRQVRAYAGEVARGCVPKNPGAPVGGWNMAVSETLAAIDRWEKGDGC